MHLARGTKIRHVPKVRLKQDVFSHWRPREARCDYIAPTTFMKIPWLL